MKIITHFFLLLLIAMATACSNSEKYKPETYLNENEQAEILSKILPYVANLPKRYGPHNRFSPELNDFYKEEVKKYRMQHYYISEKDSFHYFMINRPAPSLYEKRLAISGRFRKDGNGNITNYEESFWTFKMTNPDLLKKGEVLFNHYVEGKDIAEYMPGKQKEEWIEFPDANCYYDKNEQRWRFTWEANK